MKENPFKSDTPVDTPYFTDRVKELDYIKRFVESRNHLILISPRRFGKSSLVEKAISQTGRPYIIINLQQITSLDDFSALLLKGIYKLHPWEKMKHYISHFRIIPTVTTSPITGEMDFSFNPTVAESNSVLEDTMDMLEKISDPENRIIVVLDEFQEILELNKHLDKRLRAIMQRQKNINYIFLGSQESMMTDIFERVKSPFYHFGMLMHLSKIPYEDFLSFLTDRFSDLSPQAETIGKEILAFTDCHPYYTQQLAYRVWELLELGSESEHAAEKAIDELVHSHDLDFERLWMTFNRTDRRIIQILAKGNTSPYADRTLPTSTYYSALKKLMKNGHIIKLDKYEIEDPFFKLWVEKRVPLV